MDNNDDRDRSSLSMTRRRMLGGMGVALASVPFGHILGCAEGRGANSAADSQGAAGTAQGRGAAGAAAWATGGTAAMVAASSYPDPFTSGLDSGGVCKLTCSQVLGPCYAATLNRRDVSEGQKGLPLRLALRVVNEACAPVAGATVDIWHTSPKGVYSGNDTLEMCTQKDAEALAARWFRGVQTTDANGRVNFDTCFPGWYLGRAVHIHFTVKAGGVEQVTSQFYFDDALCDDILRAQPLYNTRGERDTRNTADFILAADQVSDSTLQSRRMPDGALLAWKTLSLRSSTGAPLCTANSSTMQDILKNFPDFDTKPKEVFERLKKNGVPPGVKLPEALLRQLGLPVPSK